MYEEKIRKLKEEMAELNRKKWKRANFHILAENWERLENEAERVGMSKNRVVNNLIKKI